MEIDNIYGDLPNDEGDLGKEVVKLQQENDVLQGFINSLESDIEKLCTKITCMKKIQDNLSRNISELYKAAKSEIDRKDKTIAELRSELDDYFFRRKKITLPIKRERDNSPSLGRHATESSVKKPKQETGEHSIKDKDQMKKKSRSRSREKDRYQSSHKERREDKRDRLHKHEHFKQRNLIRDDKTRDRNNAKPAVCARVAKRTKDSISTETKAKSAISKRPVVKSTAGKEEVVERNSVYVAEEQNIKLPAAAENRELTVVNKHDQCNKKINSTVIVKSTGVENDNLSINLEKTTVEKNNKTASLSRSQENKNEAKMSKTKIEEVAKKLSERMEEQLKHFEVKITYVDSGVVGKIAEVETNTNNDGSEDTKKDTNAIEQEKIIESANICNLNESNMIKDGPNSELTKSKPKTNFLMDEMTRDLTKLADEERKNAEKCKKKSKAIAHTNKISNEAIIHKNTSSKQNEDEKIVAGKILASKPNLPQNKENTVIEATNDTEKPKETDKIESKPPKDVGKSDAKAKKLKNSTDTSKKTKTDEETSVQESGRVLRSATRTNVQKTVDSVSEAASNFSLSVPTTSNDLISVNLSDDIPVLHITEIDGNSCDTYSAGTLCVKLIKDSPLNGEKIEFEAGSSVITSTPVGNSDININVLKDDLKLSSLDESGNVSESANSQCNLNGSLNSHVGMNGSLDEQKIFNTSSGRKKRKVILTMIG